MIIDRARLNELQISNLDCALLAYREGAGVSSPMPPVLYIELTRNCIARCSFCRRARIQDPGNDMRGDIFRALLRQYVPGAVLVDLRAWGESLMIPDFHDKVEQIARLGPQIRLTTTLGCGTHPAMQSLIDHDVFVSVSFDAADRRVYEKIRRGISYDTVIRNLEFLIAGIKKKHGNLDGRIRLGVTPLQGKTLEHVEGVIRLAVSYGIPEIRITPLGASRFDLNLLDYHKRKTISVLRKCVEYSKRAGIRLQLGAPLFEGFRLEGRVFERCCHPWLYAMVDYEGTLSYCDHNIGPYCEGIRFGHVSEPRESVWNGRTAQKVRLAHAGKGHPDFLSRACRRCYKKGRYADHEHEVAAEFGKWLVTEKEIEAQLRDLKS